MSDTQSDIIAFRRTGRVEFVPAAGWAVDDDGSVQRWPFGTNLEKPIVEPIDPATVIVAEGGMEGVVERLRIAMSKAFDKTLLPSEIRRAIRGTPPEPEPEEWMVEAGRAVIAQMEEKVPDTHDEEAWLYARIIAKHAKEARDGA